MEEPLSDSKGNIPPAESRPPYPHNLFTTAGCEDLISRFDAEVIRTLIDVIRTAETPETTVFGRPQRDVLSDLDDQLKYEMYSWETRS
jgi:hypothetical protein